MKTEKITYFIYFKTTVTTYKIRFTVPAGDSFHLPTIYSMYLGKIISKFQPDEYVLSSCFRAKLKYKSVEHGS